MNSKPLVAIILGSKSDLDIAKECINTLNTFEVSSTLIVASAHRSPKYLREKLVELEKDALVFIAMAGMAAHLPGVIASLTTKPVIGVPIPASLNGLDSLLSIAQMPAGVPVATVAIGGAINAGLLAVEIISLTSSGKKIGLSEKLRKYRQKFEMDAKSANARINT